MLSPIQLKAREGRLTASRIACLMTGDIPKINALWRQLALNEPEDDLSDVWAVQLGSCTEGLHLNWIERKYGPITRRGDFIVHPEFDWAGCTLDGWSEQHDCPVEAKHVGGREMRETVIDRYQPQMHWQMIVTGARQCAISIIEGAAEPVVDFVPYDEAYGKELMSRAAAFMLCVETMTPPIEVAPVLPPVVPTVTYDMTGNNAFASEAYTWITTRQPAKDNAAAEKALKALVPADAIVCHGHGVTIKRNRAGSLSLREVPQ